jgi:hypothetical protein
MQEQATRSSSQSYRKPVVEQLFLATYFATNKSIDAWLIDSGCSHHKTSDESMFRQVDKIYILKVRIGNRNSLEVKGRAVAAAETPKGTKLILDVLYGP